MSLLKKLGRALKGRPVIVCTEGCSKTFEASDVNGLESRQEGQFRDQPITVYFFRCPHCGQPYDSYYITPALEVSLAKLRVMKKNRDRQQAEVLRQQEQLKKYVTNKAVL